MKLEGLAWLVLVLPAVVIFARMPILRDKPLRLFAFAAVSLALLRPVISSKSGGLDLFVLVDRSASARAHLDVLLPEWVHVLESSRGKEDRILRVEFGADAVVLAEGESPPAPINPSLTATGLALSTALSSLSSDRAARILLLSDGFATQPIEPQLASLLAENVALDYRLVEGADELDLRIAGLSGPQRVLAGEPVVLEVTLEGNRYEVEGDVPIEVARDGVAIHEGLASVRQGRGRVVFADRLESPGAHLYEARIDPRAAGLRDSAAENDRRGHWVEVVSGPRVLLLTSYESDPLAEILRQQGFEVATLIDARELHVGQLAGARAIVLNNFPAHRVPSEFLEALPFYVRGQGGGLAMVGGRFSFGAGGYFESAIDPLLPVSMELLADHRKLQAAMAVVLDRSGSMSVLVGSGVPKMELASSGAARAVELLGPSDEIAVLAVDEAPHVIVGLTRVGAGAGALAQRVRGIHSQGGGIYVHAGLEAGWSELKKSQSGQRHLILFADAADAEEPGDYERLVGDMVREGATLSVIGLGTRNDPDGELLAELARLGQGRIFFTDQASELPAIFAQETVAATRSAYQRAPTGAQPFAGWFELSARPIELLPSVDAYNLSYLRPGATQAAGTTDEYEAPLIAFWQHGLGRALAVSFPLGGPDSERARAWGGYGDFAATLARWLSMRPVPAGLGLSTGWVGNRLRVSFLFGREWQEELANSPPKLLVAQGSSVRELAWERTAPGAYSGEVDVEPGTTVRGVVQAGPHALPFGPLMSVSEVEWDFNPAKVAELRALSEASGGQERLNLADVWKAPRRGSSRDLSRGLLVAFLAALLLSELVDRLGIDFGRIPGSAKPGAGKMPAVPGVREAWARTR
ncbi:MAG: VWA domain-containing protein [Deltaproteobacteria bacterium]|nr:VWA domain-containing protein [Deltaproteobacteria bacterium]